jgi:hypothetical protein
VAFEGRPLAKGLMRRGGDGGPVGPSISPSTPFASHLAQMRHAAAFAHMWAVGAMAI